jgi:hypothetical protein
MAVGKFTVLDIAMRKIGAGQIDLDSDAFKVALTTGDQAITASFSGASNDALYSDLTSEASGAGYTAGGADLVAPSWTRAGSVVTMGADPTEWTALDTTFKYAVVYKTGTGDILGFFDVDDANPAGRVVANSDFIINWTNGLFTLTRVD